MDLLRVWHDLSNILEFKNKVTDFLFNEILVDINILSGYY